MALDELVDDFVDDTDDVDDHDVVEGGDKVSSVNNLSFLMTSGMVDQRLLLFPTLLTVLLLLEVRM